MPALRRRVQTRWTPRQITGITGWWSADDLAGANGAAISSWTDRIHGATLSQATGTKQPTLVSNAGSTGHQAASFAAASLQALSGPLGQNPAQAPFFVWIVHTPVTIPNEWVPVEVGIAGDTLKGWALHYSNFNPKLTLWGVADLGSASGGDGASLVQWREAAYDPITAQQQRLSWHNVPTIDLFTHTEQANAGSTTLSIGGSVSRNNYWSNDQILQVIIGVGIPTDEDRAQFGGWLVRNFQVYVGKGYNAGSSVALAGVNNDATASSGAVELGVIYNPAGIFGHKYWIAFSPYTNGVVDENPSIAFSDDGNTWASTGFTNPLNAYPGGGAAGNNADATLLDNVSRDGKLYVYWVRENATPAGANGVFVMSYDGTSWSAVTQTLVSTGSNAYECPTVTYDASSNEYWMYTMDLTTGVFHRQTSSSPTGPWSAPVACSMPALPGGKKPWHSSTPVFINGKWVVGFSDAQAGSSPRMWLASSFDGLTWSLSRAPLTIPGHGTAWDAPGAYRPALADAGDDKTFKLWYVMLNSAGPPYTCALSAMVSVPVSEIP